MKMMSELSFFMPMEKVPTTTHQQKQVRVVNGKPIFYEPPDLEAARSKLTAHLAKHVPDEKYKKGIRLTSWWCFKTTGAHKNGEYKTTKPDTDNLVKLLKDCMTDLNFWEDDALVASEVIEKYWADLPGIYIKIEVL
ncbi:RusA family crossover junction endodeoxyribonuclease [Carnobacterium divergens]|uniref:RusA family crossover junction endodeoxyribonuclease n=1 Tax=Carnobacterium divergens TaxID=2748 RepID=UPI002890C8FF|nr:RusA family crossover junction endodeoxyribonuclease [Carnobacterium divergens]MDT1996840.1 RusA family crossover junction endodeoxyribonuclease [Carnobacterium divergens]